MTKACERGSPALRFHAVCSIAVLAVALGPGCSWVTPRLECSRDLDCKKGEVCLPDDLCLPIEVASRKGYRVGTECHVENGEDVGCEGERQCRMGFCLVDGQTAPTIDGGTGTEPVSCPGKDGNETPLFGGATGTADGPTAALIRWSPAADETPHASLSYLVFMSEAPEPIDYTQPIATLVGQVQYRAEGLKEGHTYRFAVRAKDEANQTDCNTRLAEITPQGLAACIDYENHAKPIFESNCIRCHSGANAPQGLHLDSYAGVLAGGKTGNEVVRCKPENSLLYLKVSMSNPPVGARMPFDGPPYLSDFQIETLRRWITEGAIEKCSSPSNVCSDTKAPTFSGITSATLAASGTSANLCWSAAQDDATKPSDLLYDVFQANAPGGQDFAQLPRKTSAAGETCVALEGLTPEQTFCWVVRARDAAGNRDANTQEKCVSTPAAKCVDFQTMVQPIFSQRCTHCHSGANPPRGLRLDSHANVLKGGATGNEIVACRPTDSLLYQKISMSNPPVGVRMPFDGPPYLDDAQINLIKRWISEGARASCAEADVCSDAVAPKFSGVNSVEAVNAATAKVCWSPATDNLTPPSAMVYDVYGSNTPGGEKFDAPTQSSRPGETCATVEALSPGERICFVVRARDGAGNRDSNGVEKCVVLPAVPPGCVDYASMIQPLLNRNCVRCHSGDLAPQLLQLDSYQHVIAGSVRRSEVTACSPASSLLLQKVSATPPFGKRMPFDGPPYLSNAQIQLLQQWVQNGATSTCQVPSVCGDSAAPTFAGITSATVVDATTARVCWSPATDNLTPADSIRYDIYEAGAPGTQAYGGPATYSSVGNSCRDVRLGPNTTLCFSVRARDLLGNADANTKEMCVTTPAQSCAVEYSTLIQPILSARCTHCHNSKNPPRFLDLTSYGKVLAGGSIRREVRACDPNGSLLIQKTLGATCGRRMPFDGPPYLSAAQMSLLQRWVESGTREKCTVADPCTDTQPPTFFGAQSATTVNASTARVCWNPAADDKSPPSAITYEVYESVGSGRQQLLSPAAHAAPGGTTCLDVPAPPGNTLCYVVRAKDLHGNRDSNTTERCVTLGGACVDYQSSVQTVFNARCIQCHSGANPPKGIRWDTYAHAISNGDAVMACDSGKSRAVKKVVECEMPYDTSARSCSTPACLAPSQIRTLTQWIDEGAQETCSGNQCR